MIESYGKIWAIGHSGCRGIFDDPVLIEEKVDGSQLSFGVFGGELKMRSKGAELVIDAPDKMFSVAVERVQSVAHLLRDGWTYRGEYLQKPKHNTLVYDRTPKNNIVIFDIDRGGFDYANGTDRAEEADRIGFDSIPLFDVCRIQSKDNVSALLEKTSFLGGQTIEGVVFKSRTRFGPDSRPLMAKFVSERFKEMNGANWKDQKTSSKSIIQLMIERYKTQPRWEKAIVHLRERGAIENSPRDIGNLIKEIQSDFREECLEDLKEQLLKWALADVTRGIVAGLPEWYKDRLLESAFGGESQ
jgi:hypothetical protein